MNTLKWKEAKLSALWTSILLNVIFLSAIPDLTTMFIDLREKLSEPPIIITRIVEVEVEKENIYTSLLVDPLDNYVVSSSSGVRQDPMGGGDNTFHRGIDLVPASMANHRIKDKSDQIVRSVYDGVVEVHYPAPNGHYRGHPVYGGLIIIKHDNGLYSLYAHMRDTRGKDGKYIRENRRVKAGEQIGLVGDTGVTTGPHLHFELFFNPDNVIESILKYDQLSDELYYRARVERNFTQ